MRDLIGITTYKRADMLSECLASIVANTDLSGCAVLVHNNSTDTAYGRAVEDTVAGRAHILGDGVNHGLSRALNRLARHAQSERIILMNDDIKVYPGWLDTLRTSLADERMGLVSLSLANGHAEWDHHNPDVDWRSLPLARYFCTYPTGCLMAMRREVYEYVGGFDENLWLALEEVDYGIRTMRARYRNANIGVSGESYKFAAHYGSASGGGSYSEADMSPAQIALARGARAHFEIKHGVGFPLPKDFEQQLEKVAPCMW